MQGPNRAASFGPLASLPPPLVEGRNALELRRGRGEWRKGLKGLRI